MEISSVNQQIIDVFYESPAQSESTKRKVARIAFVAGGIILCFGTEIPSILNAKAFNPFPGASQISAGAVVVYSFFGVDNIVEMAREIFPAAGDVEQKITAGKVVRISLSILLGIFSRFRGAGLTLHVAPGIADKLRLPLAIAKILGTCWPEVFSVYKSLGMKLDDIRLAINPTEKESFVLLLRENLLQCLRGFKGRILQEANQERRILLDSLRRVSNGYQEMAPQRIFQTIITRENLEKATRYENSLQSKTIVKVGLGTLTSVGTTCSLVLSAVLAKYADNTFFPGGDASWKWALAVLSSATIAYTMYTKSFEGGQNTIGSVAALFGSEQEKGLGRALYPVSHALFTIAATFLVIALYGDHYESVTGSIGTASWPGKAVLAGILFSAFFLYSQAMQGVFTKGASCFAQSRFGKNDDRELAKAIEKLEQLEKVINSSNINGFADMLLSLDLSQAQREILMDGIQFQEVDTDAEAPSELEEMLSKMSLHDSSELHALPGEATPLLGTTTEIDG